MREITREKIAGTLYGLAIGDALGRDTEFMQLPTIYKHFGKSGPMRLSSPALFTDDTQMTLAVARALGHAHTLTPRALERTITHEFIDWMRHDARRAPGVTCITAVGLLERGVRWQDATVRSSKGCGANMRVAPVAFVPRVDKLPGIAQLQAGLTHGHPTALAASELTAWAVRWAAAGRDLADIPRMLWDRALDQRDVVRRDWLGSLVARPPKPMSGGWDECLHALLKLSDALADEITEPNVCKILGESWVADEALVTALYCAIRYEDPVEAISAAARTSGDSDSIACITGALVGAARGVDVWPDDWCRRIERRGDIESAITTLWSLYTGRKVPMTDSQRTRVNTDRWVTAPVPPRKRTNVADGLFGGPAEVRDFDWSSLADDDELDRYAADVERIFEEDGLRVDGEVVRRSNGTIDHSFCNHGTGRNALRRCARRSNRT